MALINLNDFTTAELTAAINKIPQTWGTIGAMGLFRDRGLLSSNVTIDQNAGKLRVLDSHEWGAPGNVPESEQRDMISFKIGQTTYDDILLPIDVADTRAFGMAAANAAITDELTRKLTRLKVDHDVTHEWRKAGALRGVIANFDGSRSVNLFTKFGVTRPEVDFVLGTADTDILGKCVELSDKMDAGLFGDVSNGKAVLANPTFYDRFVAHANVKAAYAATVQAAQRLGDNLGKTGFYFGGIMWYRMPDAYNGTQLITAGEGNAVPLGTMRTFEMLYAPADMNETVGTIGQPIYAKIEPRDMGRGWNLHTQSNSLPICYSPGALVRAFTSN